MTAQPLTAAEQERVARFEAAPPAEESAVERVAEAICRVDVGAEFLSEQAPGWQDLYRDYARAALTAMRPAPDTAKTDEGAALIAAERQRQITAEGWTPEHDADHHAGELTAAALCYLSAALCVIKPDDPRAAPTVYEPPVAPYWPWEPAAFKARFGDPLRMLVKAGALIAAEIDRLRTPDAAS